MPFRPSRRHALLATANSIQPGNPMDRNVIANAINKQIHLVKSMQQVARREARINNAQRRVRNSQIVHARRKELLLLLPLPLIRKVKLQRRNVIARLAHVTTINKKEQRRNQNANAINKQLILQSLLQILLQMLRLLLKRRAAKERKLIKNAIPRSKMLKLLLMKLNPQVNATPTSLRLK